MVNCIPSLSWLAAIPNSGRLLAGLPRSGRQSSVIRLSCAGIRTAERARRRLDAANKSSGYYCVRRRRAHLCMFIYDLGHIKGHTRTIARSGKRQSETEGSFSKSDNHTGIYCVRACCVYTSLTTHRPGKPPEKRINMRTSAFDMMMNMSRRSAFRCSYQ